MIVHRSYTGDMNATYPLASAADLIGEPGRAAMLLALMDGQALPAGELAMVAAVSAQSASAHLSKLVEGGLLSVQNRGRHRYYRIANPEVAHAIEALATISTMPRQSQTRRPAEVLALHQARSCYDHLAGRVAVELAEVLQSSKVIVVCGERDFELGPRGKRWFDDLGIDTRALRCLRRRFARRCLDWTERRPHLAGALGAALLSRLLVLKWAARCPRTRALRITHRGALELHDRFGISVGI